MTRLSRVTVAALVVVAFLVLGVAMAAEVLRQGGQPRAVVVNRNLATFPAIPGYYTLRTENVQKELELVDEQKEKLKQIGKKYYEQLRQASQQDWAKFREMPAEQRKAKHAEMQKQRMKQMEEVRKQIEKVLLPHQIDRLKQINLQTYGASMVANPGILQQLEVTDQQKEKLGKIREELQAKIRQLQKASFEETLKVLTPEQEKKLGEMSTQGYRTMYWGQAGSPK